MNRILEYVYAHSPVFLQNMMVSAEGYRLRGHRFGGKSQQYIAKLEESQWFSEERLKDIQNEKLRVMIEHAYNNVPFYRKQFDELGIKPSEIKEVGDLKRLPILEKETLRRNVKEFMAKNISKRQLLPWTTGGSTGTPLTLYVTTEGIRYNFAVGEARHRHWAGVRTGERRATFLGRVVVPAGEKKPPFWRYNRAFDQMLFSVFHLSEENLSSYVAELRRFQPRYIEGYPWSVYLVAHYILDRALEGISPKAVLVSAETLFEWQR